MSLIIFLVILGIMVTVHELGHFLAARASGVRVDIFSIGFGKAIFKKKIDNCEFRIGLIPLGGFVKLAGDEPEERTGAADEFFSASKRARALIVAMGPICNYLLAWLLFIVVFTIGFEAFAPKIGELKDGFPAAESGLMVGDKVTAINGETVEVWNDVFTQIRANKGEDIVMDVERDGKAQLITIKPKQQTAKDVFGRERKISFVGIVPADERVHLKYGFFQAIPKGTQALFDLSAKTLTGLWLMVSGALPFKDTMTGPIGIYQITKQAAQIGLGAVLHLMAVISMSLAIFNLLPLPVLDGGHLFFIGLEAIRRKPLSEKVQDKITQVGFVLIMALMAFVILNDIQRFWVKNKAPINVEVKNNEMD